MKCGTPYPVTCDDDKFCTTDACVQGKGCVFTPKTDGLGCGADSVCKAGKCHLKWAIDIFAKTDHVCALRGGGKGLSCWGKNEKGQLGFDPKNLYGHINPKPIPQKGTTTAVSAAVGQNHTCAVTAKGGVLCWGYGGYGALGNGTYKTSYMPAKVALPKGDAAIQVATGYRHTCVRTKLQKVYCWGDNTAGQLGWGTRTSYSDPMWEPNQPNQPGKVTLSGNANGTDGVKEITHISASRSVTCAVVVVYTTKGFKPVAVCWGQNTLGQLAKGKLSTSTDVFGPTAIPATVGITTIAAGDESVCASGPAGTWCWGNNKYGQVGNGKVGGQVTTAFKLNAGPFNAVGMSDFHTCATHAVTKKAWCWGYGNSGQLGNHANKSSSKPVQAKSLPAVERVAAGKNFTCALTWDGEAYCWGQGDWGKLGNGSTKTTWMPVKVKH